MPNTYLVELSELDARKCSLKLRLHRGLGEATGVWYERRKATTGPCTVLPFGVILFHAYLYGLYYMTVYIR